MAAGMAVARLCVALLVALPWRAASSQQVPVLLWSSESSLWNDQPSTHGGHVTNDRQLCQYLDAALKSGPHIILLFLQEKLSIEDFTAFGGVYGNKQDSAFPNLESIMGSSPSSLVLPSVDWYATNILATYLTEKLGVSPLHVDQSTLLELRLNKSIPSLLVVQLPYGSNSGLMGTKDVLRANDEAIGQVLSTLKSEAVPYTALLTSLRPSRMIAESDFGVSGMRRQLLAVDTPNFAPVSYNNGSLNNSCILFWASNISLHYSKDMVVVLTNLTFNRTEPAFTAGSSCNLRESVLILNYSPTFRMIFYLSSKHYSGSGRWWSTLDRVEVFNGTNNATFLAPQVSSPREYSFHCQHFSSFPLYGPILINNSSKDSVGATWNLHITDFQIQAFNITGMKFSYASDCASFFSPGIWMGLITTLLFVFILTYGLHMVMSLKTMDRFDDPKGPSIAVPQNE